MLTAHWYLLDPTGETMWPRENPDYGAHGTNDTFCPYYGTGGFGSWPGSMASYMRANPGFRAMVAYNECQSQMRSFFAKNDYFSTTTTINSERITTEYFFNSITNGIGAITTTEKLGWEVAMNLGMAYNILCDAVADMGPPTVLRRRAEVEYNTLKQGLIEDPIFWAAVTAGIGHVTTGSLFGFRAFSHATSLGNPASQMFKLTFFGRHAIVMHYVKGTWHYHFYKFLWRKF
ncbi:hypothetical protein ES705_28195 [subsurface metagenome]